MRRFLMGALTAALVTLGLTSSASAGGWAITTLDSLPRTMQAGETYHVGYTIRQHGVQPFEGAKPALRISRGATVLTFPGRPDGAPGHYVSEVTFPEAGEWTWAALQTPFAEQPLGAMMLLAPAPSAGFDPASTQVKLAVPAELVFGAHFVALAMLAGAALFQFKRAITTNV